MMMTESLLRRDSAYHNSVKHKMNKKRYSYLILVFTIGIISCFDNEEEFCIEPKFDVPIIEPLGNEKYLQLNSDEIFNQDSFFDFHIKIPGKNLEFLNSNPRKEEYTEAMLIFEGDTLSPIGLRYKGSIGSFDGYLSNGLTGSKTSTKLSMKLKINWINKSDKFYGLKKLQFHSMNNDNSLMKERLGYYLFNQFGVKAPRCVHARVHINDVYIGVFALVENIDGRFIDYNYSNDGNIFKDVWPLTPKRESVSDSLLIAHLKNNEEDGDVTNFKQFSLAMENTNEQELKSKIETWFDMESLIKNMVVSHSIQHFDEAAFNFKNCNLNASLDDCFGGNVFWFSDKIEQKVHLIPWDLDETQNGLNGNLLQELQLNCNSFGIDPIYNEESNTILYIDKLKCGFFQFEDEYNFHTNQFKLELFNSTTLDPLIESWKTQIESSILEAAQLYDDAVKVEDWNAEIDKIRNWQ